MAIARTKTSWGASRDTIMAQLIVERMTGQSVQGFTSAAMEWGNTTEPQARAMYAFVEDVDVQETGFHRHPVIFGTGASPDGLVGADGLLEIKCPETKTHIESLLSKKIDGKYLTQMQWQMACTNRKWCDFVSFDPRLPGLEIWTTRVHRDDERIAELEVMASEFLDEMMVKLESLSAMRAT